MRRSTIDEDMEEIIGSSTSHAIPTTTTTTTVSTIDSPEDHTESMRKHKKKKKDGKKNKKSRKTKFREPYDTSLVGTSNAEKLDILKERLKITLEEIDLEVEERCENLRAIASARALELRRKLTLELTKLPRRVRQMTLREFRTVFQEDVNKIFASDIENRTRGVEQFIEKLKTPARTSHISITQNGILKTPRRALAALNENNTAIMSAYAQQQQQRSTVKRTLSTVGRTTTAAANNGVPVTPTTKRTRYDEIPATPSTPGYSYQNANAGATPLPTNEATYLEDSTNTTHDELDLEQLEIDLDEPNTSNFIKSNLPSTAKKSLRMPAPIPIDTNLLNAAVSNRDSLTTEQRIAAINQLAALQQQLAAMMEGMKQQQHM